MSAGGLKHLDGAWARLLAGEPVSADERAALTAAAEQDETFRRRLVHDLQLDGALRALGQIERGQDAFIATMKDLLRAASRTDEVVAAIRQRIEAHRAAERARTRPASGVSGRWYVLGFAAVASLAIFVLWPRPRPTAPPSGDSTPTVASGPAAPSAAMFSPRRGEPPAPAGPARVDHGHAPIARLETLEGRAYVHGGDGSVHTASELPARAGDWVSTVGPTTRARLVHVGGDQIDLEGDASAGLGTAEPGGRVFLAHGRAVATLAGSPQGGLSLASPHAIITGTGTIRLQVTPSSTRVEVTAGRAHVAALGVQRGTEVETGQFALVRADDMTPPRAQTAVREALLLVGPDDTKEDRPPPPGLRGSEELLKDHLEKLGFSVRAVEATTLSPEEASAASLLVLSPSVSVGLLARWFNDLPVPTVLLESSAFSQFGLIGARWRRDVGGAPPMTDLVITNPQHPLAAGLTGTVRVLNAPRGLRWAAPPAGADIIASYGGAAEHTALVFGFERGAAMDGGAAPARRAALPLGNGLVIRSLNEQGWLLFEAAVSWCAGH